MRFSKLKEDKKCNNCGLLIQKRNVCILDTFKREGGRWGFLYYHDENCFIEYKLAFLRSLCEQKKRLFEDKVKSKGKTVSKLGRPRKYSDPMRARSIKACLDYHRRVGNDSKVLELEEELQALTVSSVKGKELGSPPPTPLLKEGKQVSSSKGKQEASPLSPPSSFLINF